ncbi:MAG: hypothetical protein IPO12_18365 [Flavobacteriales bacterium]|nr:hypothetical protein [Flavobacteriales bacterium]
MVARIGLSGTTGAKVTANPSALTVYTVSGTSRGCAFAGTQQVAVAIKEALPRLVRPRPLLPYARVARSTLRAPPRICLPPCSATISTVASTDGPQKTASTGGTLADAAWTLRPDGYFYNASSGADPTFNSNDDTQFVLSNSDDRGSGGTTATVLKSPGINTEGYSSLSLSYYHHYRFNSGRAIVAAWRFPPTTRTGPLCKRIVPRRAPRTALSPPT